MIHVPVNLSRHSLWGAACTAEHSGLCCAARIPWLQYRFAKFSGVHLLEWSCFLVRKLYKGSKDYKGDLLSMARACTALCSVSLGSVQCCIDAGHPAPDWMQDLLVTYIPSLILSYQSGHPIKPFVARPFLLRSGKSCAPSLFPPSPHHAEQGIKTETMRSVDHVRTNYTKSVRICRQLQ